MPTNPLYVPIGERVSLGIGKETTFGTPVAPTIFHPVMDFSPTTKNMPVPRTSARGQISPVYPATGSYEGKISLEVECCPDTLPQLIAYSLGSQTAPTHNIVATTAAAQANMGATSLTVADATLIAPGMTITAGSAAPVQVTGVSAAAGAYTVSLASGLSATVANAASVTLTSTTAYKSTAKLGTPLATFTCQNKRDQIDAIAYSGCKVDSFTFSLDPKKGLSAKFVLVNQTEAIVGSPASPTYSALYPFQFETSGGSTQFNGTAIGLAGQAAVLSWQIQGSNSIKTDYYSAANGRFAMAFPEQMRKITGRLTLGFENDTAQQAFWGGTSSPGSVIPGVAVNLFMVSTDLADSGLGVPYALNFKLGNCYVTSADVAQKPGSILQQVVSFEAAQTAAGNSDDLVASWINTTSTSY